MSATGSSVLALPSTAAGGRCCARCCPASARGLVLGVFAGLLWGAGKVAVPALTRLAIDHGIIGHESLWFWSAMIAAAGVISACSPACAADWRSREPAGPRRPCATAVRPTCACTSPSTTTRRPAS